MKKILILLFISSIFALSDFVLVEDSYSSWSPIYATQLSPKSTETWVTGANSDYSGFKSAKITFKLDPNDVITVKVRAENVINFPRRIKATGYIANPKLTYYGYYDGVNHANEMPAGVSVESIDNSIFITDTFQDLCVIRNLNSSQTVDLDFSFDVVVSPTSQPKGNNLDSLDVVFDVN